MERENTAPEARPAERASMVWLQGVSCLGIVGMNMYIIVARPDSAYTPVTRGLIYFLTAAAVAILFASTTSAVFKWTGKGIALSLVGSFVLVIVAFRLLVSADAPQQEMVAYEVIDQNGHPVSLEATGQINISRGRFGASVTYCVDGNKILLEFPQQLPSAELTVEYPPGSGTLYRGTIGYTGEHPYSLKLGMHLK